VFSVTSLGGFPGLKSEQASVLLLTILARRVMVAQACDPEGWGVAARTETQWCHPIETSEIPVIVRVTN